MPNPNPSTAAAPKPAPVATLKTIGILGGSSDQATADYYRLLNQSANRRFGGWNTADVLISSMNFALSEHFVRKNLWNEAGAYLSERAQNLERAGAQILVCASNTLHRVADTFTASVKIPFVHIVDATAAAIHAAGLKRVALLGTKATMSTDFQKRRYAEKHGIEIIVPDPPDQDQTDQIIFNELCRGLFTPQSKVVYLAVVDQLHARGAQGIILGCTEIPLIIQQSDRPDIPFFNTAALHVEAALDLAAKP